MNNLKRLPPQIFLELAYLKASQEIWNYGSQALRLSKKTLMGKDKRLGLREKDKPFPKMKPMSFLLQIEYLSQYTFHLKNIKPSCQYKH